MSDVNAQQSQEAYAAYRLGRDRWMLRVWQQIALHWYIDQQDEVGITSSVGLTLREIQHWLAQLQHRLRPRKFDEISKWIDRFDAEWHQFHGSQEHRRLVGSGGLAPETESLLHNPFLRSLEELIELTHPQALFNNYIPTSRRMFDLGSAIGFCQHRLSFATCHSPAFLLAIDELMRLQELPHHLLLAAEAVRAGKHEAARVHGMMHLDELADRYARGVPAIPDLVLEVFLDPPSVRYRGVMIEGLSAYEMRFIAAFAKAPGQIISRDELKGMMHSETSERNLTNYRARIVSKMALAVARQSSHVVQVGSPEYRAARDELQQMLPRDAASGGWYLNLPPEVVAVC